MKFYCFQINRNTEKYAITELCPAEKINRYRMKAYINLFFLLLAFGFTSNLKAQQEQKLSGKILSPFGGTPLQGAVITSSDASESAVTDSLGEFILDVSSLNGEIVIWSQGYYEVTQPLMGSNKISVTLIPLDKYGYNQAIISPYREPDINTVTTNSKNISAKNISLSATTVEDALQSAFSGLSVINKSGMPGEGAYINLRGIQSVLGNNAPLIILNGVPFLPDMNESPIIGGYSKGIFNAISINDIDNITLLKGHEAALYGSIGSNGVLLIDTKKATNLETVVEFSGQYGTAFNTASYPLLNATNFNSYVADVGLSLYDDMGDLLNTFPFLVDDPNYYYQFLYNNNTDWQKEIYSPAFVTDNTLRIKGGDAIAKYDLSVGYKNQQGVLDNTSLARYNTRLNANIVLGKDIDLFSSVGFTFLNSKLHEQGMLSATNPMLTSLYKAPILNAYRKDQFNNQLPGYQPIGPTGGSNPMAVLNDVSMSSDVYDFSFNSGVNYRVTNNLKLTGIFGLYYNYNRENAFIAGKSSGAVLPLQDGFATNTARTGVGEAVNYYGNVNSIYKRKVGSDNFTASLGVQSLITRNEYDAGQGINTANDFYRTLEYVNEGKLLYGYIEEWNWMNMYAHADYTFNNILTASLNASYDGASSTGNDAPRWGFFPSAGLTWYVKNMSFLRDVDLVNKLNVRAEYGVSGNSRFSARTSRYYYVGQKYRDLSGITRGNIANTELKWETSKTLDVGVDFSLLNNRLQGGLGYYSIYSSNVIMPSKISPEFGIESIYYNQGEISNKGLEVSISADIINTKDWGFTLGGNLSKNKNILESLGTGTELLEEMSDGSAVISRVGESVYSFYGYESEGVIASAADAEAEQLFDYKGDQFQAGDVRFIDSYGDDNVIDKRDRTIIADANPDFFGGVFANVRFKQLALTANFSYSVGNQMYNAVRRSLEAMDDFQNQSSSVTRRWITDGQETDIPRASYNDPMENNRFSDRWIEDASYIRLNSLVLSYDIDSELFGFAQGGVFYLSGENLFTLTEYLGLDPVTSYSYNPKYQGFDYGKVPMPAIFKLGFKLQF